MKEILCFCFDLNKIFSKSLCLKMLFLYISGKPIRLENITKNCSKNELILYRIELRVIFINKMI